MSLNYPYYYGTYIDGPGLGSVASVIHGERTVTGLGGAWESAVEWGDDFNLDGNVVVVEKVISDTELLLALPWPGETRQNAAYVVRRGIANSDPRNYARKVGYYLAELRGLPDNMRGLYPFGAWDAGTTYPKDAVVSHADALWLALRPSTNVEPSAAAVDDWAKWLEGEPGPQGFDGWSPVLAVAADGVRRVFQVVGWVGGEGAEPPTGLYVGATGLVVDIAQAVDVRGPAGQNGTGTGDVVGPDGGVLNNEVPLFSGTGGKSLKGNNGATARFRSGVQIDGNANISGGAVALLGDANTHVWFRSANGTLSKALLYWDSAGSMLRLRLYEADGATLRRELMIGADLLWNDGTANRTVWHAGNLAYASQVEAEAGSAADRVISPAGLRQALRATGNAPVFGCRAWVNFKGTGTVATRGSGNVSSITRNGTGDYTVNFTTAMPHKNYSVVGMGSGEQSIAAVAPRQGPGFSDAGATTTSVRVTCGFDNGALTDWDTVAIAVFC